MIQHNLSCLCFMMNNINDELIYVQLINFSIFVFLISFIRDRPNIDYFVFSTSLTHDRPNIGYMIVLR